MVERVGVRGEGSIVSSVQGHSRGGKCSSKPQTSIFKPQPLKTQPQTQNPVTQSLPQKLKDLSTKMKDLCKKA